MTAGKGSLSMQHSPSVRDVGLPPKCGLVLRRKGQQPARPSPPGQGWGTGQATLRGARARPGTSGRLPLCILGAVVPVPGEAVERLLRMRRRCTAWRGRSGPSSDATPKRPRPFLSRQRSPGEACRLAVGSFTWFQRPIRFSSRRTLSFRRLEAL